MDGTHFDFDETTRQLQARLDQLEAEHRLLDEQVTAQQLAGADMITLQRMKREKLRLKDDISRVRGLIRPDIIA
ncbi:DUF465 domain-containing protein [Ponticaulis sp.]|uniref:YdcH family protein n=1 Tax=Ponticaulis sp. TaxID=2020902 RepID=UPI000B71B2E8|nr:DUF465 domain-containing protein [Ponticaulis sp.]MAJ09572.1 hypothetical protein [Ponticaulis sp.]RPG18913.1 MAG: DUF465 domain-containing protein [Hyphomonadaceae bacterium TMED125]HBH90625.1 hypothetical protein [Hyphomonadaceae bacterium]HBJ92370.1 hypothetical protein [Hyphomonadaceae bacterium]|tara:strand:- start:39740 stop:39961 length:222 start_codon:yes stop_codon:yes gene_type:complete